MRFKSIGNRFCNNFVRLNLFKAICFAEYDNCIGLSVPKMRSVYELMALTLIHPCNALSSSKKIEFFKKLKTLQQFSLLNLNYCFVVHLKKWPMYYSMFFHKKTTNKTMTFGNFFIILLRKMDFPTNFFHSKEVKNK